MATLVVNDFPAQTFTDAPALDVEIAFLSLPTEGPIWRSVIGDVRIKNMTIRRGRSRELDRFQTASLNLVLENLGSEYDPANVNSIFYGQLVPEKRVRVLASWPDYALDLPGGSGDFAWAADSPSVSVTGDIDLRALAEPAAWTPGTVQQLMPKWHDGGQWSWQFRIATSGAIVLITSPDGTSAITYTSTVATGFVDGTAHWVRAVLDVDDGAGNKVAYFYTSEDGTTWTQLGAPVSTAGTTSIFDSTARLTVGAHQNTGTSERFTGRVYCAELRNGINGPIVARADFRSRRDSTPFADTVGNTWTPAGNATVQFGSDVRYVMFDGFIEGFPQAYSANGFDSTVSIVAQDAFKVFAHKRLPASLYELVVAPDRPLHWYHLDEAGDSLVAIDSGFTSTRADGAYVAATPSDDKLLAYDGGRAAASFDLYSGVVNLPASAVPTGGAFSVSFWFRIPTVGTAEQVVCSIQNGSTRTFHVAVAGSGAGPVGQLYGDTNSGSYGLASGTRVDNNQPHHGAITSDGTTARLYLDGVLVDTWGTAIAPIVGTRFTLARGTPLSWSIPQLAEFAIWDGGVLTATQIADHYGSGATGLPEGTGTRAGRVAKFCGLAAADMDIDAGSTIVGAHDLGGGQAIDYLQVLAETERGQFYMGLDRALSTWHTFQMVWRARAALTAPTGRSQVVQATFGDGGGVELPYTDISRDDNEAWIINEARVSRLGGVEAVAVDRPSQAKYFEQTYQQSGLLYANDNDADDLAHSIVARYKEPRSLIRAVQVKPRGSAVTMFPVVLALEIGDMVTVVKRPSGGATTVDQDLVVEGIEFRFSDWAWENVFRFAPALVVPWILDDATYSVLDSTTTLGF